MADVKLITRNFSGAYGHLNGTRPIRVTSLDFMRASLTVGFQRFGHWWMSGSRFWRHRWGLGQSALSFLETRAGGLSLCPQYIHLDSSEKSAMSYWQGMIFAKLVADHHLKIPWLANVDDMRAKGLLSTSAATKERGDLVGKARDGNWHVIEAKGRSNRVEAGLIKKAKKQASLVELVNKVRPATNSACVSCLWKQPIEILLDDPPSEGSEESEKWLIEDTSFWKYYYGNLAVFIREYGSPDQGQNIPGYRFARLTPELFPLYDYPFPYDDLQIGLPEKIIEHPADALKVLGEVQISSQEYQSSDGVALIGHVPDWPERGD